MIQLDIISDPICPWCFIGKTMLDRAFEARPTHPFVVEWHPFQLNPNMPAEGMDRQDYLNGKFGGPERAKAAYDPIRKAAKDAGLDIDLDALTRTPSTLNAHRLILWAGIEGNQNAVVDALFHAYFYDLRDIGDTEVLADIADGAGLDAAMIHQLLDGTSDVELIRERDGAFREMGVSGVPTFLVNRAQAVPGMQSTELWLQVIDELAGKP